MNTPTIERQPSDRWRRHDIVFDPVHKRFGTISEIRIIDGIPVAAVDFTVLYTSVTWTTLDTWQAENDKAGHP